MNATQHTHGAAAWPRQLSGPGRGWLRFGFHVVEMQVVMAAAMVLGSVFGVDRGLDVRTEAAVWLVVMSAPTVAWMRLRRMSWRSAGEMAGVMALPGVLGLGAFGLGVLGAGALTHVQHMAMTPAMVALMAYRRRDYGWD